MTVCLLACLSSGLRAQTPTKKAYPKECVPKLVSRGSAPIGPFRFLANESYKRGPVLKFQINESGSVTNVELIRSSGVTDIDKHVLNYISKWKYKPRLQFCGIIDSEMSIIIHFGSSP